MATPSAFEVIFATACGKNHDVLSMWDPGNLFVSRTGNHAGMCSSGVEQPLYSDEWWHLSHMKAKDLSCLRGENTAVGARKHLELGFCTYSC